MHNIVPDFHGFDDQYDYEDWKDHLKVFFPYFL